MLTSTVLDIYESHKNGKNLSISYNYTSELTGRTYHEIQVDIINLLEQFGEVYCDYQLIESGVPNPLWRLQKHFPANIEITDELLLSELEKETIRIVNEIEVAAIAQAMADAAAQNGE